MARSSDIQVYIDNAIVMMNLEMGEEERLIMLHWGGMFEIGVQNGHFNLQIETYDTLYFIFCTSLSVLTIYIIFVFTYTFLKFVFRILLAILVLLNN